MVVGAAAFFGVGDARKGQDAGVEAGCDGEGFRGHPGRAAGQGVRADIGGDGLFGEFHADRVVLYFEQGLGHVQDIVGAAVGAAGVVQDTQKFFVKPFAGLVVAEEAAGTGEGQVVGDDVEGAAAVE